MPKSSWLEEALVGRLDGLARHSEEEGASFAYQIGWIQGWLEYEYDRRWRHQHKRLNSSRRMLAEAQNWRCCYCGVVMNKTTVSIDHIIPKQRKGGDGNINLVACCHKCNNEKSCFSLIDFMDWKINYPEIKFSSYIKRRKDSLLWKPKMLLPRK